MLLVITKDSKNYPPVLIEPKEPINNFSDINVDFTSI
jgi:hypothetical protein